MHLIVCFGAFGRRDLSASKVGRDGLAMMDRIGDFLYGIGGWSKVYEI